jgi:TIR domain
MSRFMQMRHVMTAMISYSRNDWRAVKSVVSFLRDNGLAVWVDRDQIRPNMEWRQELLRTPRQADAFVPFLSRSYIASEMCRMELFLARSFGRPIFPVMLEECWHALDSREETKYIAAIFAARLKARKLVGLRTTRDEILSRLLRAINNRSSKKSRRNHNVYISYPNGAASFATKLHSILSNKKIRPWVATKDCEVGDDWRKVQVQAMAEAKAHLIVISRDFLRKNDVLRTEVLMSEAFQLPTFCVISPALVSEADIDRVYAHISNGDQAFRRLAQRQWYKRKDIEGELRVGLLQTLKTRKIGR